MNNFLQFTDIDNVRISIDYDIIKGIIEQNNITINDNGKEHKLPNHCLLLCGNYSFRVKGTYDEIMAYINESIQFKEMGI